MRLKRTIREDVLHNHATVDERRRNQPCPMALQRLLLRAHQRNGELPGAALDAGCKQFGLREAVALHLAALVERRIRAMISRTTKAVSGRNPVATVNIPLSAMWRSAEIISKAKTACEASKHAITDHLADVRKMVDLGSGSYAHLRNILALRLS
jgi:hypothetical protein